MKLYILIVCLLVVATQGKPNKGQGRPESGEHGSGSRPPHPTTSAPSAKRRQGPPADDHEPHGPRPDEIFQHVQDCLTSEPTEHCERVYEKVTSCIVNNSEQIGCRLVLAIVNRKINMTSKMVKERCMECRPDHGTEETERQVADEAAEQGDPCMICHELKEIGRHIFGHHEGHGGEGPIMEHPLPELTEQNVTYTENPVEFQVYAIAIARQILDECLNQGNQHAICGNVVEMNGYVDFYEAVRDGNPDTDADLIPAVLNFCNERARTCHGVINHLEYAAMELGV